MFIFVNDSKPRTINLADELNKMTIKNRRTQEALRDARRLAPMIPPIT